MLVSVLAERRIPPIHRWGVSTLNAAVACKAVSLSAIHKDPFDRLIIATALVYDGRLASVDSLFPLYPEIRDRLFV